MAKKPFVPPRDLFDQLRDDLKAAADNVATLVHPSARQKLDHYLEPLGQFAVAWLIRLLPRKATVPATARDEFNTAIDRIVAAITHKASLDLVVVPKGVLPLGITNDGKIEPVEYPDLPTERRPARQLACSGGEPPPADDQRSMPERMAEWKAQCAEIVRRDAPERKAAEEIYGPHGVFEQAMPTNTLRDRILFRWEREYIERTLRHALMSRAEALLLNTPESDDRVIQVPPRRPTRSRTAGRIDPVRHSRTIPGKRAAVARNRRSEEVHAECDPALKFLGWSAHDWADNSKVSPSAMDRILNGLTKRVRRSTGAKLVKAMKEELEKHNRLDLLMNSPRWPGK